MFNALSDFVIFCRIERRFADLTCKAYERAARACVEFLRAKGIASLSEIRTRDLRAFLAAEATSIALLSALPTRQKEISGFCQKS